MRRILLKWLNCDAQLLTTTCVHGGGAELGGTDRGGKLAGWYSI